VLVVDDNPVNLEIYAEYLRENGFAVTLAQNGQEALTVAHQEYPDLILMDIQMPGMDGMSVIRHLRADDDPALSTVPILALTALVMPGDRERCLQAGANAYWSKPFVLRDLVAEIQRLLEEKE
jgi:CheY-like chemotaxis protein